MSHHSVFVFLNICLSVCLQEKRDKQVWNKRRQILYTVEKVGLI